MGVMGTYPGNVRELVWDAFASTDPAGALLASLPDRWVDGLLLVNDLAVAAGHTRPIRPRSGNRCDGGWGRPVIDLTYGEAWRNLVLHRASFNEQASWPAWGPNEKPTDGTNIRRAYTDAGFATRRVNGTRIVVSGPCTSCLYVRQAFEVEPCTWLCRICRKELHQRWMAGQIGPPLWMDGDQ